MSTAVDRARGALYGLAIGDALGMPTQLMSHEEVAACFGVLDGFREAPADHLIAAGLPAGSNEPLARFADAARGSASSVRLSARYLTGANKERDFELAKARERNVYSELRNRVQQIVSPAPPATTDAPTVIIESDPGR